jgi:TonB family protein
MRRRLSLSLVVMFISIAPSAMAVDRAVADRWASQLATISSMLKVKSYQAALPILRNLTNEMMGKLGPGDETTNMLVAPLIQTAVAEEGLGHHDAALWHWDVAQTLYPKAAESDLSMFGEPGAVLKQHVLADPNPAECPKPREDATKPTVLKYVNPQYPDGARKLGARGIVIMWLKVRPDGSVAEPRVVKALPAPLTYAALEAARMWKFKPAELDGRPIEANFCLTINYRLN